MNLRLLVVQGPDLGKSLDFSSEELILVGRGKGCQLQVLDPSLSRQHCRFHCSKGRIQVTDAGSSWGTHVNGEPIDESELRPGDEITIGETVLEIEVLTSAEAATLAPPNRQSPKPASIATAQDSALDALANHRPSDRPNLVNKDEHQEEPKKANAAAPGKVEPPQEMPQLPYYVHLDKLAGWRFARYDIVREVARSRTGIVYEAFDATKVRPVALKFLWPAFALDTQQVQRFIRAMRTMMQFKHPNLIKLRGAGRERELCWVASEWVAGESVTELINRIGVTGMLDWQRCWKITHDVAKALEFAHEKNLVHRNILPGNIMVRDEDRQAKLGDLMLARALDATDSEKVTKAGEVVGNVSFMAPEQLTGDVPPDPRIDIYSLGATTYAMLTGRPPFESESSMELLRLVLSSNPDPPTKYNLAIPPLMVDLVMRMLAKNPRDRYENMTSVIRDLERVAKFSGGIL